MNRLADAHATLPFLGPLSLLQPGVQHSIRCPGNTRHAIYHRHTGDPISRAMCLLGADVQYHV